MKLQFWDTAGQERFRSLTSQYVSEALGVIVVYDITSKVGCKVDRSTFEAMDFWINEVRSQRQQKVKIYIVANKIDLVEDRFSSN